MAVAKRKKIFCGKCISKGGKRKLRMIFEALKSSNPRGVILNFLCNKYKLAKSELVRVTQAFNMLPKNISLKTRKVKKTHCFKRERASRGSKFPAGLKHAAMKKKKRPNKK